MPFILTLLHPIYEICVSHFHARALKWGSGVLPTSLQDTHFWVQQPFCSCSWPILLLQQISKTWGNKASPCCPLLSVYTGRPYASLSMNSVSSWWGPYNGNFFPAKLPHHTLHIFQRMEWIKPGLLRALASFLALIYFSSQNLVRLVMHSHIA